MFMATENRHAAFLAFFQILRQLCCGLGAGIESNLVPEQVSTKEAHNRRFVVLLKALLSFSKGKKTNPCSYKYEGGSPVVCRVDPPPESASLAVQKEDAIQAFHSEK